MKKKTLQINKSIGTVAQRSAAEDELIEELFQSYENGTFTGDERVSRKREAGRVDARVEINRDLIGKYNSADLLLGLKFFERFCEANTKDTVIDVEGFGDDKTIEISKIIEGIYNKYGTTRSEFLTAFTKGEIQPEQQK